MTARKATGYLLLFAALLSCSLLPVTNAHFIGDARQEDDRITSSRLDLRKKRRYRLSRREERNQGTRRRPPPYQASQQQQLQTPTITYHPGDFSNQQKSEDENVLLSNGLAAKPIAISGEFVQYADGSHSNERFHIRPDGAAVFETQEEEEDGWYYVSNAETRSVGDDWTNGGVGSLEFDQEGNVVYYDKVATQTRQNCGGGKTPWNSWITCEEIEGGKVWQVDPTGRREQELTELGSLGMYESFAHDTDTPIPTFYVTRDANNGVLKRFTPNEQGMECYQQEKDDDRWCTLEHGTIDYLHISGGEVGTFRWTTDYDAAKRNAENYYPNGEGIDVVNGRLYFTSKRLKRLTILDLREMTYTYHSTRSGAFNHQPDQVARLVHDDANDSARILYMCEDGGQEEDSAGVFGRTVDNQYFTILQGLFPEQDETTGLAFSPDGMHMYVTFQKVGIVYDVWRDDQLPFHGAMVDIKYHTMLDA